MQRLGHIESVFIRHTNINKPRQKAFTSNLIQPLTTTRCHAHDSDIILFLLDIEARAFPEHTIIVGYKDANRFIHSKLP